jgi:hypothetical protein
MSVSYTLSDIAADFGAGAKHVANKASPFLTFEFGTPPKIFKSTMASLQSVFVTGCSHYCLFGLRMLAWLHCR